MATGDVPQTTEEFEIDDDLHPIDKPDAYTQAVNGMTQASIQKQWGDYDPERDFPGTEQEFNEAKRGHADGLSDEVASALDWLIDNPLAFIDAYAEIKRPRD